MKRPCAASTTTWLSMFAGALLPAVAITAQEASDPINPMEVLQLPSAPADHRYEYGPDPMQFGELRLPASPGPHPVAVVVHGGCWLNAADLSIMSPVASALRDAGLATWNMEYRRFGDPGGGWPGTFADVGAGIDFVRELAGPHDLDLSRLIIVGHSSGGHLALWGAARAKLPADSALRVPDPLPTTSVVSLAGPGDLRAMAGQLEQVCGAEVRETLVGADPAADSSRVRQSSPAEWLPLAVRQRFVAGGLDPLVPASALQRYVEIARETGDDATLTVAERSGHFDLIAPGTDTWALVQQVVLDALPAAATRGRTAGAVAELDPCSDVATGALCGALEVPEDRSSGTGRMLSLRVVVLPATGPDPAADALFSLAGGPGQGAAELADVLAARLAQIRRRRDIVLVDLRGTGASNRLDCGPIGEPADYFGAVFPRRWVSTCREALEGRADLTLYTSAHAVDDLDQVREWLGYDQVNLWGSSYGTRVAQVFLRRHPTRVRSMILDGVVPMGRGRIEGFARYADESLRSVIAECRTDSTCSSTYPDFAASVTETFAALAERGADVEFTTDADGTRAVVSMGPGDLGYAVRGLLYSRPLSSRLPAAFARARNEGSYQTFAEAYYFRARALEAGIAYGLHLSSLCAEDLPGLESGAPAAAQSFLGGYLLREYREACELWPRATLPADFYEPVTGAVPTLLMSGAQDPVTPPAGADQVARGLSNSRHLVWPHAHHGVGGAGDGCAQRLAAEFLDTLDAAALDAACVESR